MSSKADIKTQRYIQNIKGLTQFLNKYVYLIIGAIAAWLLLYTQMADWDGFYYDADGYMRALRVRHFLQEPSFGEQLVAESNYPFGEVLHWTRPMDILWALVALPFYHLGNLSDTVFLSGAFLAPLLGIATTLVLAQGIRRHFNVYLTLFGCFIFLSNPVIMEIFSAGRPDHHALMLFLSVYAETLCLCWLKKKNDLYLPFIGIILSLAVFTVVEGIILYALVLIYFLYLYIYKNGSLVPPVKISKYFAIALTLCLLLNPPYEGFLYPDNGRLSIVYVVASWLCFSGFYILSAYKSSHQKIISLLAMSVIMLIVMAMIFGKDIFLFPINKEVKLIFHRFISEYANVMELDIWTSLCYHGFSTVAVILSIYMLKQQPYRRLMVLNLVLGLPLYALSLLFARFSSYQAVYIILPFLCLSDMLYKKSDFSKNKQAEFPGIIWGVAMAVILLEVLVTLPDKYMLKKQKAFFSSSLCAAVYQIGGTLLTDIFLSPQYVWHCHVNTVGTPYHRNQQGILDNYAILDFTAEQQMRSLLKKHQVTQILLFNDYSDKIYPLTPSNERKLYYRLIKHENIPAFLEKVPTKQQNAHLYKVKTQ